MKTSREIQIKSFTLIFEDNEEVNNFTTILNMAENELIDRFIRTARLVDKVKNDPIHIMIESLKNKINEAKFGRGEGS